MNKKIFLGAACALIVLCTLYFKSITSDSQKQTLLIQAISDSTILTNIRNEITPLINAIIKEELGLDKNSDVVFFLPKKINRLTLYYLFDLEENGKNNLFSALDAMKKINPPQHISIATTTHFFGDQHDELVVMINDLQGELSGLNNALKTVAHASNDQYKCKHHKDLFNIKKSEQHSFLPHIGLGRIRIRSIQEHIKEKSNIEAVLHKIRQRIEQTTLESIKKNFNLGSNKIFFNTVTVLDLNKQEYLKSCYLW